MATTVHGSASSGTNAYFTYTLVTENQIIKVTDSRLGIRNSTSSSITLKNISSYVNWDSPNSGAATSTSSILKSRVVSADSSRKIYPADDKEYFATRSYYRDITAKTIKIMGEVSDDVKGERGVVVSITIPALPKFTINYYIDGTYVSAGSSSNKYTDLIYERHSFIDAHGTTRYCSSVPKPTKTGYTFKNWIVLETGATSTTGEYHSGSPIVYHAIAQWTLNTYTLTYDANNGSVSPTTKNITYNSTYGTLATPTRTGYNFQGWYTAASGGTQVTANTICTGDATIYAHWTPKTYTLTYDANNGSVSPTTKNITYNSSYGSLATPTRTGYDFQGWYTAASGGTQVTSLTPLCTGNATIYAHWTPHKLTINFYANGATHDSQSGTPVAISNQLLLTQTTNYDGTNYSTYGLPNANGGTWKLSKSGYHATNLWHKGSTTGATISADIAYATNQELATNLGGNLANGNVIVNLYADLTTNSYTVIYNKNAEAATGTTASNVYQYNETKALTTNGFHRIGYTFQGWATSATGPRIYTNGQSVTNIYNNVDSTISGTVNLYAVWVANSYIPEGDYKYQILTDSTAQAQVKDTSKTTYSDVPATFTVEGKTFIISSLENCFNNCSNLQGDIFISHTPEIYTNIFNGIQNSVYILSTNENVNHSTWKTIANTNSNITYCGADDDYSYTVLNRNNMTMKAKLINFNRSEYYGPVKYIKTNWTTTSMEHCFEGHTGMHVLKDIPDSIINMSYCFKDCSILESIPSIPIGVENMSYCFYNCAQLIVAPTIPAGVVNMSHCFEKCNALTGNITVYTDLNQNSNNYVDIFKDTNLSKDIFIINGITEQRRGEDTIKTTWMNISESYLNVYYEAEGIDFSNAIFNVTRRFWNIGEDITIDSNNSNLYAGSYIETNFQLEKNKIKHCPVGWSIIWDGNRVEEKIGDTEFNINGNIDQTDAQIFKFTDISQCLPNNDSITLTIGFIIDNEVRSIHTEPLIEFTATLEEQDKKIIKVDYKDNDYIYTIIADDNQNDIHEVAAYAYNKSINKTLYANLENIILNNKTYTITSLHYPVYDKNGDLDSTYLGYCYENCIGLITPPILPATVLDLTNCFSGCNNLIGNVLVDINPIATTNMFTNTRNNIFIVNQGHSNYFAWESVVNTYSNVHYEGADNNNPKIISINATRGKLSINTSYEKTSDQTIDEDKKYYIYNLSTNEYELVDIPNISDIDNYYEKTSETQKWISNDTEEWVRLEIITFLDNNCLPLGWTNEYIREFYVEFRGIELEEQVYVNPNNISYVPIQSKTVSTSIQYYGLINNNFRKVNVISLVEPGYVLSNHLSVKSSTTYYQFNDQTQTYIEVINPTGIPKEQGWYEQYDGNYYVKTYSPQKLVIYFKDWTDSLATAIVGVTDFFGHEGTDTETIYQIFAMLDFIPGGHGMAIGKIGKRNGLDIGLPTTIGVGLLPPNTFVKTIDTEIKQEKTYYIRSGNSEPYTYTEVSTPVIQDIDNYYEETIDLTNSQLVIGDFNKINNDAILVVGNGTDENNRSNLMEIGDNSIRIGKSEAGNLIITKDGDVTIGDGLTELATFGANGITLGKADEQRIYQSASGLAFVNEDNYYVVNMHTESPSPYYQELVIYNNTTTNQIVVGSSISLTQDGRDGLIVAGEHVYLTLNSDEDLYTAITALGWQSDVIV